MSFGTLLRDWRQRREMSQLVLSLASNVSSRHISFLETGRSAPSRAMVLTLATVLELSVRDRNLMLEAAGFKAPKAEVSLDSPEMATVREALTLLLKQHDPAGAIVVDQVYDVVLASGGFIALLQRVLGDKLTLPQPYTLAPHPRLNFLKLLFDPNQLRPLIPEWEKLAKGLLARINREAPGGKLREPLHQFPGVKSLQAQTGDMGVLLPLSIDLPELSLRYAITVTTLGPVQDATPQDHRVFALHPRNKATEEFAKQQLAR